MKLEDLRDKHKGERCFIIGTGSSLNKTNMSLLKNETCFGVNRLYEGLNKWGISCKYYAVGDNREWIKFYKEILKLDSIIFLSEEIYNTYPDTIDYSRCFVIKTLPGSMWSEKIFSTDLTVGKVSGDNIIIDCLQYAFYLGFAEVYLLGCDCDVKGHFYKEENIDLSKQWEETHNPRFSMDYNVRCRKSFLSYEVCKQAYEMNKRKIYNCTVVTTLRLFERVKLEDVIM